MIGATREVLDHGFVRLVDHMGSDLSIVRAARVSYNADWRSGEDAGKDEKLINYMLTNKHSSPFEAVVFTFEVRAPIFVFRQWHRHRTWSYNEISARYTELDEGYYLPEASLIGTQSKDSKQARDIPAEPGNVRRMQLTVDMMRAHCERAFDVYKQLLADGVPRELARSVLPVAAYSRMFATVDLHNLFHFLRLRLNPHAQYEIRVYAEAILDLAGLVCPLAVSAFRKEIGVLQE